MRSLAASALAVVIVSISGAAVFADEWKVIRLRGSVLQHVDGEWQKLSRGGMVPDDRVIRTLKTGNVELQRGNETITIGPDTQIQIFDEESTRPFTTVKQYFGKVTVDAEARKVEHFAVQTPYLAAVVKGTKFVVTSGETGADVAVKRGHVFVEDKATKESTTLNVGQSASVDDGGQSMMVAGWGIGAPQPVTPAADDPNTTPSGKAQNSAAKSSGNGNSGNGGNNGNGNGNSGNGANSGNSGQGNSGNGNSGNGNGSGNAGNNGNGNGNSGNSGNSGNGNGGSGPGNNGNGNANGHGKNGKG
jgi:hypothetical protein